LSTLLIFPCCFTLLPVVEVHRKGLEERSRGALGGEEECLGQGGVGGKELVDILGFAGGLSTHHLHREVGKLSQGAINNSASGPGALIIWGFRVKEKKKKKIDMRERSKVTDDLCWTCLWAPLQTARSSWQHQIQGRPSRWGILCESIGLHGGVIHSVLR